jgi:hypothetical protein
MPQAFAHFLLLCVGPSATPAPYGMQDRSVFPIVLAVQKLSGVGADSIFMGVVRNRVDEDPNTVKVRGGAVVFDNHV